MSGIYAQINKDIRKINGMVDLYQLDLPRGIIHLNSETGGLTKDMAIEISNKIDILNDEISECDKTLGELKVMTLPSSELTEKRKVWENKKQCLLQIREKMELVRTKELEFLKLNNI